MFQVVKRDGEIAEFQMAKITSAIDKAFDAKEKNYSKDMIDLLALRVTADFRITQVVHLDKRCQIRIKRRKCLRTSPFILHDSKEIHHLITKDTQVLCRRGCNLAFDATQPFFDKLFQ